MDRKKKIIAALGIVGIGTAIALQFQRDYEADVPPALPVTAPVQTASAVRPGVETPHVADTLETQSVTAFDGRIEPAPGTAAPPRDPLAGKRATSVPNNVTTAHGGLNENNLPDEELVDLNAPEKSHRIVDGDSLMKLAQRYLGRSDRYLDIYAYNRDVLNDPDVLPIGASIRIPAHVVLAPEGNSAAGVTPPPVLPLTPLPPPAVPAAGASPAPNAAPATAAAPAAKPAAAQRNGPRTYTVQAGDNLVDIARKMYGDGRKHETLFQANRRTMKTPTDLKPGTVLVVP